jgi:hypothetical protein
MVMTPSLVSRGRSVRTLFADGEFDEPCATRSILDVSVPLSTSLRAKSSESPAEPNQIQFAYARGIPSPVAGVSGGYAVSRKQNSNPLS